MSFKREINKVRLKMRGLFAGYRKLPDFLIIGTQKGGTSSLTFYLAQHPELFFPMIKEVHFFDLNYSKGLKWYRSFFPFSSKKLAGEATPYYLFHPHVPKRIKKDLPNVKFIVLLREPVSRAYSQYKKERSEHNDNIESFEQAFFSEKERTEKEIERLIRDETYYSYAHQRYTYFKRGLYYEQIECWLKYFNRDQFLFLKSEDLFAKPRNELSKAYAFLNIKEMHPKNLSIRNQGVKEIDEKMIPAYYDYFKNDLDKLKKLLGENFSWQNKIKLSWISIINCALLKESMLQDFSLLNL